MLRLLEAVIDGNSEVAIKQAWSTATTNSSPIADDRRY
jgi:hypothetical protein